MEGLTIEKVTISEPNYTTWTYQRTIVYDAFTSSFMGMHVDEDNNLLYLVYDLGGPKLNIYDVSDGTQKFVSGAGDYYGAVASDQNTIRFGNSKYATRSLSKYLSLYRADQITIEVWAAPATSALWSRDITLDVPGAQIKTILISPTGKYIIVQENNALSPNIYVYLGS